VDMRSALLRGPTFDLALALGGVVLGVLSTHRGWVVPPASAPVAGLLVVGSGLLMWAARRWSIPVFLSQTVLLVVGGHFAPIAANAVLAMLVIALGTLAVRASWPVVTGAYLVAFLATGLKVLDTEPGVISFWRIVAFAVFLLAPVAIGRYLGSVQAAEEARRTQIAEAAQREEAQRRAALLAERSRIGRDLHDIVAHHVGAMVLRASAAAHVGAPEPVTEALADIRRTGTQVLEDLRGLLAVLRDPDALDDVLPGGTDPEQIVTDAVDRLTAAGLNVDYEPDAAVSHAPLVVRTSVARIVQEGLTNVVKHGGPDTTVRLAVIATDGALLVRIDNDLPAGTDPELPSNGYGLAGIRERVELLGGELSAGHQEDGGWRVSARLPYRRTT
jgi:signal transduction histidine kinase